VNCGGRQRLKRSLKKKKASAQNRTEKCESRKIGGNGGREGARKRQREPKILKKGSSKRVKTKKIRKNKSSRGTMTRIIKSLPERAYRRGERVKNKGNPLLGTYQGTCIAKWQAERGEEKKDGKVQIITVELKIRRSRLELSTKEGQPRSSPLSKGGSKQIGNEKTEMK